MQKKKRETRYLMGGLTFMESRLVNVKIKEMMSLEGGGRKGRAQDRLAKGGFRNNAVNTATARQEG